jgi:hypothetical protein
MPTLQTLPSTSARAVAGVPGAIVAAKQTNAQAKARKLIIIFVNFVFMVIVSFCLVLLCWPSIPHHEELFLAVHRSTERKSARGYAGSYGSNRGSSYRYVFSTTRTDDTPVLLVIWRSVILDGCRGIELEPGDIARALDDMKRVGAILLKSSDP